MRWPHLGVYDAAVTWEREPSVKAQDTKGRCHSEGTGQLMHTNVASRAEVFYLSASAPLLEEEMMEHRESNLTHRQRSNEASLGWLLVCTVGAALFAVMIATQGALAHDITKHDPQARWFQKCALTKTGQFDPIVYPNTPPPIGNQKLFYGATAISYNSTRDSLLAGGTT